MPLAVITWTDARPSGGNTYNRELVAALRALGVAARLVPVPGGWPQPSAEDVARLAGTLRAHRRVLADGIVACTAPEAVAEAVAAGTEVTVLVHMPLADEVGLDDAERARRAASERAALSAATRIVCTSEHAAATLRSRHPGAVVVAPPGARRAPVAAGSGAVPAPRDSVTPSQTQPGPHLLMLGALSPTKDPRTLVQALARVADLPWTAELVGAGETGYVTCLRQEVEDLGLAGRTALPGPRTGTALERTWARTDLLVLPSRTETYGLVVAEALAHAIPAVVSSGTGAVEALAAGAPGALPGRAVPAGDVGAWAATLRGWLTDAELRQSWRAAALATREHLPTWASTGEVVRDAVGLTRPPGQ